MSTRQSCLIPGLSRAFSFCRNIGGNVEVMRTKKEINLAELEHKRYLTNREAQVYLNTSHTTLWRLMKAREIAYSRAGLTLLFDRNDLDDYVRRNRTPTTAE